MTIIGSTRIPQRETTPAASDATSGKGCGVRRSSLCHRAGCGVEASDFGCVMRQQKSGERRRPRDHLPCGQAGPGAFAQRQRQHRPLPRARRTRLLCPPLSAAGRGDWALRPLPGNGGSKPILRGQDQFYRLIHGDNLVDGLAIAAIARPLAEAGVDLAGLGRAVGTPSHYQKRSAAWPSYTHIQDWFNPRLAEKSTAGGVDAAHNRRRPRQRAGQRSSSRRCLNMARSASVSSPSGSS